MSVEDGVGGRGTWASEWDAVIVLASLEFSPRARTATMPSVPHGTQCTRGETGGEIPIKCSTFT